MEKVNVYNRNREITDKIKERNSLEKGEYRISVHIWIINSKSELLIQQRLETSKKFPSMWSQTGGGVLAGETSKEAVKREAKFISFEDFDNMIKDKKVVPTINPSYFLMKNYIDNYIDKN